MGPPSLIPTLMALYKHAVGHPRPVGHTGPIGRVFVVIFVYARWKFLIIKPRNGCVFQTRQQTQFSSNSLIINIFDTYVETYPLSNNIKLDIRLDLFRYQLYTHKCYKTSLSHMYTHTHVHK